MPQPGKDDPECARLRNSGGGGRKSLPDDTSAEIDWCAAWPSRRGAEDAVHVESLGRGGAGAVELAKAVVAACREARHFRFLYPLEMSIKEKIETIVREMYGGSGVEYSPEAGKEDRAVHAQWLRQACPSAWPRLT